MTHRLTVLLIRKILFSSSLESLPKDVAHRYLEEIVGSLEDLVFTETPEVQRTSFYHGWTKVNLECRKGSGGEDSGLKIVASRCHPSEYIVNFQDQIAGESLDCSLKAINPNGVMYDGDVTLAFTPGSVLRFTLSALVGDPCRASFKDVEYLGGLSGMPKTYNRTIQELMSKVHERLFASIQNDDVWRFWAKRNLPLQKHLCERLRQIVQTDSC